MDVLKPPLVYIDGRCYRKLPFEQQVNPSGGQQSYEDGEDDGDDMCDALDLVEKTDKGYKLSLDVPNALFGSIIGRGGEIKKRIERETNTIISIPKKDQDGAIVITGPHKSGVLSASNRIEVIAESSRQKVPPTHFLSFPLYNDKLVERFQVFKQRVLQECGQCQGVDPSLFQIPSKLHLTIGMMTLLNETEVIKASEFLSDCYKELVSKFLANTPLVINLRGVDYMNDDPFEVNILYMKVHTVDGSDRLQRLADTLLDRFVAQGLMKKEYNHIKLHATLMNSKFRENAEKSSDVPVKKSRMEAVSPRHRKRMSFDAKDIVEMFDDFDFGDYHIPSIHLSQRGKFDAEGHYFCAASVPLP